MIRKLTLSYSLCAVAPFVVILTLLIAAVALAQTSGAGPTGKANAVSQLPLASAPAPAQRSPIPWTDGAARFAVGGLQTTPYPPLFLTAVTYDSGGQQASSVAVADVNGDGKPDLIVTNCGACYGPPSIGHGSSVGVLLGNGDGTFQPAVTYNSGGEVPVFVAVADVNGDGKPDLVVVNRNSVNIGVLLGNGDGTFQPAVTYGSASPFFSPMLVAVADLNGDSKPDLVVASWSGDENNGGVGILLNNGDGTFQPAVMYLSGGAYGFAVAVADVNGDRKPDVLVANSESSLGAPLGSVGVLLGKGDGTLQAVVAYTSGGISLPPASSLLAVADVNGDVRPDIVVESSQCCGSSNGVVGVLLGNGDGTFQPVVTYQSGKGGWGTSVAVVDATGNGKPDIVATDGSRAANGINDGLVAVLLGNGDGTFQAAQSYSSGGFLTNSVAVADVNGDGRPDLVVANLCADNTLYCTRSSVGVLLNNTGVTKALVTTSGSPSLVRQPVTFTATVSSEFDAIPDGELVTFYDGKTPTPLGSVALAGGTASYTTSSLSAGTHSIKATYPGDVSFKPSHGSVTQVVQKYVTTTTLSSSVNSSNYGQPVTLTATVTSAGPAPTGWVTFKNESATLGSKTLNAGGVATLTTTKIPVGTDSLTAAYSGDASNGKSVSAVITQTVIQVSLSMVLASTPSPSALGKSVKFTASLTSNGGLPSGQPVTFSYNGATLGTANVNSYGVATFFTTTLPRGSDAVAAAYAGNLDYSSAAATVTQVVN